MSTNYTTTIPETDCIGDSLVTINNNFDKLGTTVLSLSTTPSWIPNNIIAFDGGAFGFKNKVINGAMNIWQRGTTFSNISAAYTADRMLVTRTNSAKENSISQSTLVPSGFQYSIKMTRTPSSTNFEQFQLRYALETADSIPLQGNTVTLSFWAKAGANTSGTDVFAALLSSTTVDISPISNSFARMVRSAKVPSDLTNWTKWTVSSPVPSTATQLGFGIGWTPAGTAGADDSLYITGLQLEVGPTATPFEYRPIGTELALCQRYYQKTYSQNVSPGTVTDVGGLYSVPTSTGTGVAFNNWRFSPIMRTIPATVVAYNPVTGATGQWRQGATNITAQFTNTSDSGVVISNVAVVVAANGMNIHATAEAEL